MNARIIQLCVLLDKKNEMYVVRHHYRHKIRRLQDVLKARDEYYVLQFGEKKISKRMMNASLRDIRKELSRCIIAAEKNRLAMYAFTEKYRRRIAKLIKQEELSVSRDRHNHYYNMISVRVDSPQEESSQPKINWLRIADSRAKIKEIASIHIAEKILLGGK